MRPFATILLLSIISIPSLTCAEPAPQAQPTVESESASSAAPAELLRNGKAPFDDILTGGQPTPEQFQGLADLGYRTVINMRSTGESGSTRASTVEALGMTYVALPIAGAQDVSEANARKLASALEANEHPVVVHCASGNRVGALFALKAYYVDGESAEDALAVGKAAGVTRLEPLVREQLGLE